MANTLYGHRLPDQLPIKGHDAQYALPDDGKLYGPSIKDTEDLPIVYQEGKLDHYSDAEKHPGFAKVQAKIAAKEGISADRAGAILAASSRGASKAAKKANPNLRKVKG